MKKGIRISGSPLRLLDKGRIKKSIFLHLKLVLVLLLGMRVLGYAQAGQSGLAFLKLGVGARSLAMSEAAVASANDPSATYYNPAGLRFANNPQLLVMHKEWIQGTQTEFLAASLPSGLFSFGFHMNATSIPDIEIRQRPGPADGTFSARNVAIGGSAAYSIDSTISIGATVKYLYEKILVDETFGIGMDVGGVYRSPWDITFGASLSNVGSMGKLRTESSKLPTTLRLGASRAAPVGSLDGKATLEADVVSVLPEKTMHLLLGGEFTYDNTFSLRAGYVTGYDTRNVTAGVGLHYDIVTIDYAYVPFRLDLGTTHTFSVGFEF